VMRLDDQELHDAPITEDIINPQSTSCCNN
jgi:hypothetical protein